MHPNRWQSLVAITLCGLLALAGIARGQPAANPAVQGTIKGVSAAKDSFTVTAKKADMPVKINADTRFILDDMPSDAAKALLVGYDVNAIMSPDGSAFVVIVNSVALKGTVKEIAADKSSFVISSKKGVDTTVKLTGTTKFTLGKKESTLEQALAAGNTLTVDLGPDGAAAAIVAKAAKADAAPAAVPPTPVPTVPPVPAQPPAN